ncbi:hypothetical protein ACHAXA_000992 [Cyclostephanos tholiformis]|uniref:Uncharacterized protein n=1 Tax=Cyclostephanos tholiformis TaxID=382380 RepID=A0ABD3SEG9_9STRA
MDYYYPDRIAEDDDDRGDRHAGEDALKYSLQSSCGEDLSSTIEVVADDTYEHTNFNNMAALIQNERNRRLGVGNYADADNGQPASCIELPPSSNPVGVLGNIRGWFGGGGSAVGNGPKSTPAKKTPEISTQSSASVSHTQSNKTIFSSDDSSSSSSDDTSNVDDDYTSSQSSNASDPAHGNANLTPQERARARALRYLYESCVDAGRKAKTASYVRGLERLDLKRRRDRYEKELEIVEAEMYKDRELIKYVEEEDVILAMAAVLVWEVPRTLESKEADAGAGSGLGEDISGSESFMAYEDYADAMYANGRQPSPWDDEGAVKIYEFSLQSRLKDAQERTRSLDKRLAVLEQAGDDIISSLCEDLAEVTGHSNKVEARYVKKRKVLQRKRRREELLYRSMIKQAELRVRSLEERLLIVSGDQNLHDQIIGATSCDTSNEDSIASGDDDENDEVLLEKKLSAIKAKNEQDKIQHEVEVESIRRQCEQFKLRLSVARLVMEGDDNLREYISLLERQRKSCIINSFIDRDFSRTDRDPIPAPPCHITRARAKLLKVAHLECIYEQRLSVSKAFTDATINALDQELLERESAAQKMEVRCLNELLLIDLEIKDFVKEASDKLSELESEANELDNTTLACIAQNHIAGIGDIFSVYNTRTDPLQREREDRIAVKNETSCGILIDGKNHLQQFELEEQISDVDSPAEAGIADDELLKPESSLQDQVADNELVVHDSIAIADTLKIEHNFADVMPLLPDDRHNSFDSIVKCPHTVAGCPEFDRITNDTGNKTSRDLSACEIVVGNSSSPQVANAHEPVEAFLKLKLSLPLFDIPAENTDINNCSNHRGELCDEKGKKSSTVDSLNEAVLQSLERELNRSLAEQNVTAIYSSKGSTNGKNLPIIDIPAENTEIKKNSDQTDKQSDEKGNKSSTVNSQKEAVLQSLGRELNCTLAEYQTSYDLSTSSERVEQLNYMNDLVLAIAKLSGLRIENADKTLSDQRELKSWSYKRSHRASSERKDNGRKSSIQKKKKSTRQPRGSKGKTKANDGLDRSGLILKLPSGPDSLDCSLVW